MLFLTYFTVLLCWEDAINMNKYPNSSFSFRFADL